MKDREVEGGFGLFEQLSSQSKHGQGNEDEIEREQGGNEFEEGTVLRGR